MRAVRDSEIASQSIGLDPTADPHHGVRASPRPRRACRRRVRLDQQLHQPGVVSLLPVDPVPAGGDARRRRPRARPADRRAVVVLLPELLSSLGAISPAVCRRAAAARAAACARSGSSASLAPLLSKAGKAAPPTQSDDVTSAASSRQAHRQRTFGASISRSASAACSAVSDLCFAARARRDHQHHRPQRRRQEHRAQPRLRLLSRPIAGTVRLGDRRSPACLSHQVARAGIARTYQTTQLFAQHERHRQRAGRAAPRPPRRRRAARAGSRCRARRASPKACSLSSATAARSMRPPGSCRTSTSASSRSRARSPRPAVLALDEPAAGLDPGRHRAARRAAAHGCRDSASSCSWSSTT